MKLNQPVVRHFQGPEMIFNGRHLFMSPILTLISVGLGRTWTQLGLRKDSELILNYQDEDEGTCIESGIGLHNLEKWVWDSFWSCLWA